MGPVIVDPCDHFEGLIALDVVGQLSDDERVALTAHLDGCPTCRDEHHALGALTTVLHAAEPDRFDEEAMPFELHTKVLDALRAAGRLDRSRRHRRVALGAVAAVVVALAVLGALTLPGGSPNRSDAGVVGPRRRPCRVVRLTAETWGTAVHLEATDGPKNTTLWVTMQTASGSWWFAGTYRTTAHGSVQVDMACTLPLSQIEGVSVPRQQGDHRHARLPGVSPPVSSRRVRGPSSRPPQLSLQRLERTRQRERLVTDLDGLRAP